MKSLLPLSLTLLAAPLAAQNRAYLVDSGLDQLFSVDVATGAATLIAPTNNNGLATPADLTWRGDTGELWTVDLSGGAVGTIDTTNGTFTPIYQTGLSGWQGMAWDPVTQMFYLANQSDSNYVLDPVSGTTTLLGSSGFSLITCLDVDAAGNLFGIDFSSGTLVQIDKTTGVATGTVSTISGMQGLAIDGNGNWFGSNTTDDSLHSIDVGSGQATLIGAHGAGVGFAKGFDIANDPNAGMVDIPNTGCPGAPILGRNVADATPGGSFTIDPTTLPCGGTHFLLFGVRGPFPVGTPVACATGCRGAAPPTIGILAPGPVTINIPASLMPGVQLTMQAGCLTTSNCVNLSQGVEFTVQ